MIRRQREAGQLIQQAPRTYRTWGTYRSWHMRAHAAVLSARAPALISHRSAAYLWGLTGDVLPGIVDVTVPRHRRPRRRAGVQFHESRVFDLARPRVRHLLSVTGVARTILDCCGSFDRYIDCLHLLDEARRLKLVEWEELWECLLLHAGRGRRGGGRFRRLCSSATATLPLTASSSG